MRPATLAVVLMLMPTGAYSAAPELSAMRPTATQPTVCELIDAAAAGHDLPVWFFTRLIWQESSFRPQALSPKGAQGIAQFMPATAARRGLSNPYDPAEAIPASAHYLDDLRRQFGNLGLAAAAYNAGEQRVSGWLSGSRSLPHETRNYVATITGLSAETWAEKGRIERWDRGDERPRSDCLVTAAILARPGAGSTPAAGYPTSGWAPWGAQIAGGFSRERVIAAYASLRREYTALIGEFEPMVVASVQRSRGSAQLYSARVPASSRDEAEEVCAALRKAGGACIVLKSEP